MKRAALIATVCGCAIASAAFAQGEEFPITSGTVMYIPPDVPPGFSGRSVVVVWGTNDSDFRGYNTAVPPARAANDFNFTGGPAGSVVGSVPIVSAYFAVVSPAGDTHVTADVRVSLYSTFDGWINGTFPGSDLIGQETVTVAICGFAFCDPRNSVTFDPPVLVPNIAGTDGMFMVELFLPGTTTLHPTIWTPASFGTALVTGTSDPQRWGDSTGPNGVGGPDGLVQPLNGTAVWEVNSPNVAGGRAIYGGLWAEIPTPLTCDSIDFNNDSSLFDPQDIDAFLSVYSEGPCVPASAVCNDIDFNNDTSLFDPCDISAFLVRYAEGPCTACGV